MRINQHRKSWSTSVAEQLVEDFKKRKFKKKKLARPKLFCSRFRSIFFSRVQVISSQCGHVKEAKQCAPYRCLLLPTNYKRRVRSLAKIQTPILQMSCIKARWIPPKNLTGWGHFRTGLLMHTRASGRACCGLQQGSSCGERGVSAAVLGFGHVSQPQSWKVWHLLQTTQALHHHH